MRIALIQSADDLSRYPYADTLAFVESCCRGEGEEQPLLLHLRPVTVEAVNEEGLQRLFAALDPLTWRALIFATNALNSDFIWAVLERHEETLLRYLEGGGGVVFFQGNYRTPPRLSRRLGYTAGRRLSLESREYAGATARGTDDVLLAYPDQLDFSELAESSEKLMRVDQGSSWGRLFWEVVELKSNSAMIPVIQASSGEILVARTGDTAGMRVVTSKILADWHRRRTLFRNLLSFALTGAPTALVLGDENEAVAQSLAVSEHIVRVPADQRLEVNSWLGRHVQLALTPMRPASGAYAFDASSFEAGVIGRGGSVLAAQPDRELRACRVNAIVGSRESRKITEQLLDRLAANPGWGEEGFSEGSVYRLRNILVAMAYLRGNYDETIVPQLSEAKERRLVERLRKVLSQPGEPLVTTMAAAESLEVLGRVEQRRRSLANGEDRAEAAGVDILLLWWSLMPEKAPNQKRLINAISDAVITAKAAGNIASVARVCEAIAIMSRTKMLQNLPDNHLSDVLIDALGDPPSRVGWLSTETTATIIRGLVAVAPTGSISANYARVISEGAASLRHELYVADVPPYAVGWYSRITEALVAVDSVLPTTFTIAMAPSAAGPDDMLQGLRDANTKLHDQSVAAIRELSESRQANRLALPVGWALILINLLLLIALPFILPFFVTNVPVDRRIAVTGIIVPLWYGVLFAAIRRYPLVPLWLRHRFSRKV
jgi:hypothetical protein